VTGIDRRLRDLLEAATGEPPHQVSAEAVRRRVSRRRAREYLAGAAAVAVIAVLVPLGIGAAGHAPGPAGRHRSSTGPTVYVAYEISRGISGGTPAVIPLSAAASKAGNPIKGADGAIDVDGGQIAITPDGKTAYVPTNASGTVIPISTATNQAAQSIELGHNRTSGPDFIAITPDGRTAYVASLAFNTVTPISTATNTPGRPIRVGSGPIWIAITPDGRTAYVANESMPGTVTPIDTATNTAGQPIHVSHDPFDIAITPDGRTAYVLGRSSSSKHTRDVVTPINTATNTPGQPIYLPGLGGYGSIAITPDGKTAYVNTGYPRAVIPISTATNRVGKPIELRNNNSSGSQIVISPDGKTAYVIMGPHEVVPVSTATNTADQPIQLRSACRSRLLALAELRMAFTPDGKTLYVACEGAVVPVNTATNTPGRPVRLPLGYPFAIAIKP
jgi:YVTN family beta-propeller protein